MPFVPSERADHCACPRAHAHSVLNNVADVALVTPALRAINSDIYCVVRLVALCTGAPSRIRECVITADRIGFFADCDNC